MGQAIQCDTSRTPTGRPEKTKSRAIIMITPLGPALAQPLYGPRSIARAAQSLPPHPGRKLFRIPS